MAPGIASDVWTKEFDAMVVGLIEIIDTTVARMKDAGFGRILVIGSSGIVVPIPKLAVSNTLRSAVGGYVKTLAEQVASYGVTCNMVLPGRVETPRTQAIDAATAKSLVFRRSRRERIRSQPFRPGVMDNPRSSVLY